VIPTTLTFIFTWLGRPSSPVSSTSAV
jgi:hypothetical protein